MRTSALPSRFTSRLRQLRREEDSLEIGPLLDFVSLNDPRGSEATGGFHNAKRACVRVQ